MKPSDTTPNDREIENLNSKLDLPKVDFNENAKIVLAAHQFLDEEGAKGNSRVSF